MKNVLLFCALCILTGCASPNASRLSGESTSGMVPTTGLEASDVEGQVNPMQVELSVADSESPGLGHVVLWYIPNRVLDLLDIFRARLRVGPGLAANLRVTDYADAYIGKYRTAYIGLPGPRMGPELRSPIGWERENGVKLLGVDATDDLPHEPGYSPSEFNAGAQLLIVGLELGFDPIELGDFFAGFILRDFRGDDR